MYTKENTVIVVRNSEIKSILSMSFKASAYDKKTGQPLLSREYTFKSLVPEGFDPAMFLVTLHYDHIVERMLWHLNND